MDWNKKDIQPAGRRNRSFQTAFLHQLRPICVASDFGHFSGITFKTSANFCFSWLSYLSYLTQVHNSEDKT